jgi:hypothetical protein
LNTAPLEPIQEIEPKTAHFALPVPISGTPYKVKFFVLFSLYNNHRRRESPPTERLREPKSVLFTSFPAPLLDFQFSMLHLQGHSVQTGYCRNVV